MQPSIRVDPDPAVQYVLRIGDTCLILGQRLGEWCGHAPVLEEDIAMANMALDLVGQARALLTRAGQMSGRGYDEDQLAFLRDERDYRNLTLVELPRGDFAFTVVRNAMIAGFLKHLWSRLLSSSDAELAGDRRQGDQGGALPPAACGRLDRAAGRRHRRVAPAHRGRARHRLALHAGVLRGGCGRRCGRGKRPRPALGGIARALAGRHAGHPRRGGPRACPPKLRFAAPASAGSTASTWATSSPDAVPAACVSGGPVVSALAGRQAPAASARPGRCSARCWIRRCRPCRCATSASSAT